MEAGSFVNTGNMAQVYIQDRYSVGFSILGVLTFRVNELLREAGIDITRILVRSTWDRRRCVLE